MKSSIKYSICYLLFIFFGSCVYTEEVTPSQRLYIAFEKDLIDVTLEAKGGIIIIEHENELDLKSFELDIPSFRWGRGIILNWVYRNNDPEDIKYIYINKNTEKFDSFSINGIKAMQSIMVDSLKVYLLPEERLKQKL